MRKNVIIFALGVLLSSLLWYFVFREKDVPEIKVPVIETVDDSQQLFIDELAKVQHDSELLKVQIENMRRSRVVDNSSVLDTQLRVSIISTSEKLKSYGYD